MTLKKVISKTSTMKIEKHTGDNPVPIDVQPLPVENERLVVAALHYIQRRCEPVTCAGPLDHVLAMTEFTDIFQTDSTEIDAHVHIPAPGEYSVVLNCELLKSQDLNATRELALLLLSALLHISLVHQGKVDFSSENPNADPEYTGDLLCEAYFALSMNDQEIWDPTRTLSCSPIMFNTYRNGGLESPTSLTTSNIAASMDLSSVNSKVDKLSF
jgi:hypothetical protein